MEQISPLLGQINTMFEALSKDAPEDAQLYHCPLCRDCGYIIRDGMAYPCSCQAAMQQQEKQETAGLSPRLQRMNFANFDLHCYPEDRTDADGHSYRKMAELALRKSRAFVDHYLAGQKEQGLLLEGPVGCGKTHLTAAIANALIENGVTPLFLVVPEFLEQLRYCYRRDYQGPDEETLMKQAFFAPVLILDDMGAHNFTEWVQNQLFTIINHRYNQGLPCIITTNLSLYELEDRIGPRTVSRIVEMCDVCQMQVDLDMRIKGRRV